jgi:hypothetical protein
MNDVFDFFDRMIVVDDVYVFSLLLMNDDVYPNDLYLFPVMMIRMIQIQEGIVDDENRMYHENLFDADYYV